MTSRSTLGAVALGLLGIALRIYLTPGNSSTDLVHKVKELEALNAELSQSLANVTSIIGILKDADPVGVSAHLRDLELPELPSVTGMGHVPVIVDLGKAGEDKQTDTTNYTVFPLLLFLTLLGFVLRLTWKELRYCFEKVAGSNAHFGEV